MTGKDLEPVSLAAARAASEARSTMRSPKSELLVRLGSQALATATEALQNALGQGEIFGLSGAQWFGENVRRAREIRCDAALAEQAVKRLIGCYPERNMVDARAYAANLVTVFLAYPAAMVMRCVDPVHGLPSKLSFFPSVADVSKFLADMDAKIEARLAQGRDACDTGPYKRLPPDTYEKPGTPESRRAFVEAAMGRKPGAPVKITEHSGLPQPKHVPAPKPAEHLFRDGDQLIIGTLEKRPPIDISDFPDRAMA